MSDRDLQLIMDGLASENGHVRLEDFLGTLQHLRRALLRTEALLTGKRKGTAIYRVADLSHSSPATVSLEGVGAGAADAIAGIFEVEETVRKSEAAPEWADNDLLNHFLVMTQPVGQRVGALALSNGGRTAALTEKFRDQVRLLVVADRKYMGSIVGRLERINLHADANEFWLYPLAGPTKVKCRFADRQRQEAAGAVDRRIRVSGLFKQSSKAKWPSEMDVRRIEVLPRESELPTLDSLRGIAPEATGALSSEEFVRTVRDEWDKTG